MSAEPTVKIRRPSFVVTLAAIAAVFFTGAAFMAATSSRIQASNLRDAATRDRERAERAEQKIAEIQAAQTSNVAIAGCRAQYQDRLAKAQITWFAVFGDLVVSLYPGHTPITDADARIAAAVTGLQGAQADLDKFNNHPVIPCPIPPASSG